jgi:hypothetical protein
VIVKEEALVIEKASEEVEGGFQLLYLIITELKSHIPAPVTNSIKDPIKDT